MISLTEIQAFFHGRIKLSEPVAGYSPLGIGGPADYLFEAESAQDRERLLEYLRMNDFPHVVLQKNTVVSEKGFHGAVIVDRNSVAVPARSLPLFVESNDVQVPDLLRRASVSGILLGGAEIAGNTIVNAHNATAGEIYALVLHVQQLIKRQSGVLLEPGLQFVGFEEESLARVA